MKGEKFIYPVLFVLIVVLIHLELGYYINPQNDTSVIDISGHEEIWINVNCTVYLSEGDNEKLVIEGPKRALSGLMVDNKDGKLSIKCDAAQGLMNFIGFNQSRKDQIKISVNHSDLDKIHIMNDAKVISSDYVLSDRPVFYISLSRMLEEIIGINKTQS